MRLIDSAIAIAIAEFPHLIEAFQTTKVYIDTITGDHIAVYYSSPPRIAINKKHAHNRINIAALLIHEGTHAYEETNGIYRKGIVGLDAYLASELRAKLAELEFWRKYYPNGKYPEREPYDIQANIWLAAQDPAALVRRIYTPLYMEW